jgi:hypothetical protein
MQCMCCLPFHMSCVCTDNAWHAWDTIKTLEYCHSKPLSTQAAVGPDLVRPAKPPSYPQVGICCTTKNHMPWICCKPCHISHGCMCKVWQACDLINRPESCPSKPQNTQDAVGPDLMRTAKPPTYLRVQLYNDFIIHPTILAPNYWGMEPRGDSFPIR